MNQKHQDLAVTRDWSDAILLRTRTNDAGICFTEAAVSQPISSQMCGSI